MNNARIAIFEDDPNWREVYHEVAGDDDHTVVAAAATMDEAEDTIARLEPGSVDIALVDGNLSDVATGADGERITSLLHERFEGIVVIGISGSDKVVGADHNVSKTRVFDELPGLIQSI